MGWAISSPEALGTKLRAGNKGWKMIKMAAILDFTQNEKLLGKKKNFINFLMPNMYNKTYVNKFRFLLTSFNFAHRKKVKNNILIQSWLDHMVLVASYLETTEYRGIQGCGIFPPAIVFFAKQTFSKKRTLIPFRCTLHRYMRLYVS